MSLYQWKAAEVVPLTTMYYQGCEFGVCSEVGCMFGLPARGAYSCRNNAFNDSALSEL